MKPHSPDSAPPARILVVSVEPPVREGCRQILAAEGYAVAKAGDDLSALATLQPGAFDLALVVNDPAGRIGPGEIDLLRLRAAEPRQDA